MVGCGSDDGEAPEAPELPDYPIRSEGPFDVGYRTLETEYQPPVGGTRTIRVHVWYPATEPTGDAPTYEVIFTDEDVHTDAPLAPSAYPGGFPLTVYSHGNQGFGGDSAERSRYFASHGWVAIAPDHKDNTLTGNVSPLPTAHFLHRPLDIRAAIDALDALPNSDDLSSAVDTSRVLLTAHSFGTYTTWGVTGGRYDAAAVKASCDDANRRPYDCTEAELNAFSADLSDPRVVAAIPMAGGRYQDFFGDKGQSSISVPIALMTGSNDDVGAADLYDNTSKFPLTWVDIDGGCHLSFSLGSCKTLADADGFAIVNTFALAFGRYHVLDDGDDSESAQIVEGRAELSPLATIKRR